jgi:hypothetical protein
MKKKFSLYKLAEREQKEVLAGDWVCVCGCAWANCGGSSTIANAEANLNYPGGKVSRDFTPQDAG